LTVMEDGAFSFCSSLHAISLPRALRSSIEVESVFRGCPGRPTWRRPDASTAPARAAKRQRR
jgi:hypothetical protein